MKAKNNTQVRRGYLLFAVAMCCSILTGFTCVWSFVATASREVARMEVRSREYDVIFARQISLTEKADSIYNSLTLLGVGQRINEAALHGRLSARKMSLMGTLGQLDDSDALLYGRLSEELSVILQVKDSIRAVGTQVELIKGELQRCMENNRRAARQLTINPSR